MWGATQDLPLNLWLSQTSQFESLNFSIPSNASDSINLRIVTGQGNEIRHFRSFLKKLLIFTSGALWSLSPSTRGVGLSPTELQLAVEEYIPTTNILPIVVKNDILIVSGVSDRGYEVQLLGYSFQNDAYVSSDLTVLSRDLFIDYTIEDWAYAHSPYRLLACVRSDGKLMILTLLAEYKIFAWTIWETDGIVENICSVLEGIYDTLYVTINRNGNRTIEALRFSKSEENSSYLDSWSVQNFAGVGYSTLMGLSRFNGKNITVRDRGQDQTALVTDGTVTLQNPVFNPTIGLPYTSYVESLPLYLDSYSYSKEKIVKEIIVKLKDTKGLYCGTDLEDLEYIDNEDNDSIIKIPIPGDWGRSPTFFIQSNSASPMRILHWTSSLAVASNRRVANPLSSSRR